jgi:hypothetical protein
MEVVELSLRGEEATETHRDGTGTELSKTTGNDNVTATKGGQTSCKGEGNGKAVRETDNTVTLSDL